MSTTSRRWPAWAVAAVMLAYAAGKAYFAVEARLGLPGGPVVPAAEHESYFMDVSVAQWTAAATGVVAAAVALATVTAIGRKVPRGLMVVALFGMLLGIGAGAMTMVLDGFIGLGVGWQWYHGLAGLGVIGLLLATTHSYLSATRRRAPA